MSGLANSVTEEMLQQHLRSRLKGMGDDITNLITIIEQIDIERMAGEAVTKQGGHIGADGLLYKAANPTKPLNIIICEDKNEGDIVKCRQLGDITIPTADFLTGATVWFGQSNLDMNLTTDLPVFNAGEIIQPVGVATNSTTLQISIGEPGYKE